MKVLISDNLGEAGIKLFEKEDGIDVDVNTGLSRKNSRPLSAIMTRWSFAVPQK